MDILHSWMQHSHKKFKDETLDFNEFDGFSPEAAPAIHSDLLKSNPLSSSLSQLCPSSEPQNKGND